MASTDGERSAAVRHAHRASGQAGALASMIADERPFTDVAQQLLALRGSLEALLLRLIELELGESVPNDRARVEIDRLLRVALGRNAPRRRGGWRARRPQGHPVAVSMLEGSTPP